MAQRKKGDNMTTYRVMSDDGDQRRVVESGLRFEEATALRDAIGGDSWVEEDIEDNMGLE